MRWLNKLPEMPRSATGLEWVLWRRLPWIWLAGNLVLVLVWAGMHWYWPVETAAQERRLQLADYMLLGALAFHWTGIFTIGFGCVVVMLMKGPGYVADGLEVSHSDQPRAASGDIGSPPG